MGCYNLVILRSPWFTFKATKNLSFNVKERFFAPLRGAQNDNVGGQERFFAPPESVAGLRMTAGSGQERFFVVLRAPSG